MNGLSIAYHPRNIGYIWSPDPSGAPQSKPYSVPDGLREFEFFFKPIFDVLARLYWYDDGSPTSAFSSLYEGNDENGIHHLEDNPGPGLFNPGILPAYAWDVPNDWQIFVGIEGGLETAVAAAKRLRSSHHGDFVDTIEQVSNLALLCIDGFMWEIYAHDFTLIERVRQPLLEYEGLLLRERTLKEYGAGIGPY